MEKIFVTNNSRRGLSYKQQKKTSWFLLIILLVIFTLVVGFVIRSNNPAGARSFDREKYRIVGQDGSVSYTVKDTTAYISISPNNAIPEKSLNTAVIFYPGGFVTPESYLQLWNEVATKTNSMVYIVKPMFNLAFSDLIQNTSVKIVEENLQFTKIYYSGHSLGGVVACERTNQGADKVTGLILLGSYCNSSVKNENVLSIEGLQDGLSTQEKLNANRNKLPGSTKVDVIAGMNHAQFGDYGSQQGDNEASISAEAARQELVTRITEFLQKP